MATYTRKEKLVNAIQLQNPMTLHLKKGNTLEGKKGDWLISEEDGNQFFMKNKEFQEVYTPTSSPSVFPYYQYIYTYGCSKCWGLGVRNPFYTTHIKDNNVTTTGTIVSPSITTGYLSLGGDTDVSLSLDGN